MPTDPKAKNTLILRKCFVQSGSFKINSKSFILRAGRTVASRFEVPELEVGAPV